MTVSRNANLDDLAQAIQARLDAYCPLLAQTLVLQSPDPNQLVRTIANIATFPAAAVLIGDWENPGTLRAPALPVREIQVGILLVGSEDLLIEDRASTYWAVVDQVYRAFLPSAVRGDDESYPIALLGDQTGDDRGTMIIPAGWTALDTRKQSNRAAGILSFRLIDDVRQRTDDAWIPDGSPIPVPTTVLAINYSADGETWSATYTSGDYYARFSVDGGDTWSETLQFRGSQGPTGSPGAGFVSVDALPETPTAGTIYLLSQDDDDADAAPGAYLYRDGYYRAMGDPDAYALEIGAAYTIPSIMGQCLRLTLTEACAFTFPPVVPGGAFRLQIANSDSYDITWPAGLVYDGADLGDYAGDAAFSVTEAGSAWCLQITSSGVA